MKPSHLTLALMTGLLLTLTAVTWGATVTPKHKTLIGNASKPVAAQRTEVVKAHTKSVAQAPRHGAKTVAGAQSHPGKTIGIRPKLAK